MLFTLLQRRVPDTSRHDHACPFDSLKCCTYPMRVGCDLIAVPARPEFVTPVNTTLSPVLGRSVTRVADRTEVSPIAAGSYWHTAMLYTCDTKSAIKMMSFAFVQVYRR